MKPQPLRGLPLLAAMLTVSALASLTCQSAPFTAGNVAVLRVNAIGVLTNGPSAQLLLDEYATNGSLVQTIPIPTNGANSFVVSASAVAEATLSRTPNGRWLCFAGFNGPAGVTGIDVSPSTQYGRVLATMDVFGNFNLVGANTNLYNGQNIRGCVSDGTNNFWGYGSISGTTVGGFNYYGYSATASAVLSANLRMASFVNGSIYFTSGGISKFNGAPFVSASATQVINTGSSSSPYEFAFNLSGKSAYVSDDRQSANGGIQCWTNSGAAWTLLYTLGTGITNTGARGLAADWSGPHPVLYASTSENSIFGNPANRFIRIADTGPASTATTFATAATNGSFRGVAFVPVAIGPQSQVQTAIPNGANITVNWSGVGGSNYVVQASTNLSLDSFKDISPVITLPGSGIVTTNYIDTGALSNSPVQFYRLRSN
jgi:hypothetical protein